MDHSLCIPSTNRYNYSSIIIIITHRMFWRVTSLINWRALKTYRTQTTQTRHTRILKRVACCSQIRHYLINMFLLVADNRNELGINLNCFPSMNRRLGRGWGIYSGFSSKLLTNLQHEFHYDVSSSRFQSLS